MILEEKKQGGTLKKERGRSINCQCLMPVGPAHIQTWKTAMSYLQRSLGLNTFQFDNEDITMCN